MSPISFQELGDAFVAKASFEKMYQLGHVTIDFLAKAETSDVNSFETYLRVKLEYNEGEDPSSISNLTPKIKDHNGNFWVFRSTHAPKTVSEVKTNKNCSQTIVTNIYRYEAPNFSNQVSSQSSSSSSQ